MNERSESRLHPIQTMDTEAALYSIVQFGTLLTAERLQGTLQPVLEYQRVGRLASRNRELHVAGPVHGERRGVASARALFEWRGGG